MEWTYISDKKPEEDHDYWVSCIVWGNRRTPCVCLAYYEEGVWRFSDDMISHWKDEGLGKYGWIPYAYMEYVIPEPAKVREK